MRQQTRSEETRNRILKAAKVCFSRSGYDAASVDDICKEADITKGAFYYHFASKEALFLELQKIWLGKFEESLSRLEGDGLPAGNRLVELQDLVSDAFHSPDNFMPLTIEFLMYAIRHQSLQKNLTDQYQHEEDMIRHQIELGIADSSIQSEDPAFTARAMIGMVLGQILLGCLNPHNTDWGRQIKESVRFLLKGPQLE